MLRSDRWRFRSGGKTPRFFSLAVAAKFLSAANQDSDTAGMFTRAERGRLVPADDVVKGESSACIGLFAMSFQPITPQRNEGQDNLTSIEPILEQNRVCTKYQIAG